MKARAASFLVFSAIMLAIAIAAIPSRSASAQKCYNAQNVEIPCPEEQKKRPTVIYPSFTPSLTFTPTPTVTSTPTFTPAVTATPTATEAPIPVTGGLPPVDAELPGGFTCPPYANSVPLGAAALGAGLLLSASRRFRLGNHRDGALHTNSVGAAPPGLTQTAIAVGSGGGGSGAPAIILRLLARMSPRDPASGLPSMNQGAGAASGAVQGVGTAVAGAGAGVLGAGALAGLVDLSCIGAPILLPAAALAGLMAALAAGVMMSNAFAPPPASQDDGTLSTFTRIGTVDSNMEVRSGSGIYKDSPLE